VESVEKGSPSGEALSVFFARNVDYRWFHSPKVQAGERAVYLLHTDQKEAYRLKGFFVVDELDVVRVQDIQRVRELIKKSQ